jgi:hypothetical protein
MRPLNRPMFKMGGPVKEGIMDGIREPEPRQGYFLGGLTTALNVLRTAGQAGLRGAQASRAYSAPFSQNLGFKKRAMDIFLPRKSLTAPMAPTAEKIGFGIGSFARTNPVTTALLPSTVTEVASVGLPLAGSAAKGFANLLVPGQRFDPFKPEKPEEIVKKSNVGQVGKKGEDTKVEKTGTGANQFDDDGTKKSTSVDRLLKGVVTRAKRDAAANTAIKFGQQLRTGQASIKDPSSVIDVASGEFDKVSDIQSKVDLARIENELKKQQIKEQAIATDKYLRASAATGKPVDFVARKTLGIPTSISETVAIFEKAQPGVTKTNEGTQIVAKEWADTEGINFQGVLGGDDDLKKANKIDEFKLNPESFILEKIEELDGNDGLYVFGTNVFEYNNGVVKKIKN